MAVIKAKPTSPGRRGVISIKSDLHKGKPLKSLIEKKSILEPIILSTLILVTAELLRRRSERLRGINR